MKPCHDVSGASAGLETSLLGFSSDYWDDNCQAIHDKIPAIVVIREKQPHFSQ